MMESGDTPTMQARNPGRRMAPVSGEHGTLENTRFVGHLLEELRPLGDNRSFEDDVTMLAAKITGLGR